MELRIQYAKRADGAKTALGIMGSGPPLVVPPGRISHLEWFMEDPNAKAFRERLAERHTLVLYDRHGCGLSDRNRTDFSLEDDMLDIDAVVETLRLERFALFGISWSGLITITYASRHPERVTRLIFYGTGAGYTPGQYPQAEAQAVALAALKRANPDLHTKAVARVFFPSGADLETLESFARLTRIAAEPEMEERLATPPRDLRPLLAELKQPALVLHRRGDQAIPFGAGQELAMLLPNARFVPLEGDIHIPSYGDTEAVLRPVLEFLAEDEEAEPDVGAPPSGGMVTILFTDMESSTALTQRLGDAKAQELVRDHNAIVRDALKAQGGSEIKHTGDGIMASIPTASKALECAIAIQRAVDARKDSDPPLRIRIGLNAGEPVAEEDDLFGTAVQLTRRICDHAEPGQVLVADVVRQLAAGKGFLFSDIGDVVPKGFEDPVRLYEVRWTE